MRLRTIRLSIAYFYHLRFSARVKSRNIIYYFLCNFYASIKD